jgi:hypothetical protein
MPVRRREDPHVRRCYLIEQRPGQAAPRPQATQKQCPTATESERLKLRR